MKTPELKECKNCREKALMQYLDEPYYAMYECLNDECMVGRVRFNKSTGETKMITFFPSVSDSGLYNKMLDSMSAICKKFSLSSAACAAFCGIAEGHAKACVDNDRSKQMHADATENKNRL